MDPLVLVLRRYVVCYFYRDMEVDLLVAVEAVVGAFCLVGRWDCAIGSVGYYQEGCGGGWRGGFWGVLNWPLRGGLWD